MVKITFIGMEPTEAIKSYVNEKISKNDQLNEEARGMEVIFTDNSSHRGTNKDFRVDINVLVPNSLIHVEEIGADMYAAVDKATDVLFRRYKKYCSKKSEWKGTEPWKVEEADSSFFEEPDEEQFYSAEYIPKIAVRKKLEDMTPIEEAEAIERMELMGYRQLLFKNKTTGKISMVYKRDRGGYGIVEPAV